MASLPQITISILNFSFSFFFNFHYLSVSLHLFAWPLFIHAEVLSEQYLSNVWNGVFFSFIRQHTHTPTLEYPVHLNSTKLVQ